MRGAWKTAVWGGVWLATVAAALVACGGGGDAGGSGQGTLRVALTDAPSCGYDAVKVTVDRVRVHQSSTAADGDAGWSEVVLATPRQIDLLTLTNGVLEELGQTALPAGRYSQLRLVLGSGANANTVTPTGGAPIAMATPSAQQSGLKMNIDATVESGKMIDLVLDFDACKSVVRAGNSGNYNLKPVVAVTPRYVAGVTGVVEAALANGSTAVSLQVPGVAAAASAPAVAPVVVRSTVPAADGRFTLPAAPGTYDLVLTAPNRTTAIVTGITVTTDTVTSVNTGAAVLAPPASTMGTAAGTVTITPAPTVIDASVAARQTLAAGKVLEIASIPANATTGAYTLSLPTAAPLVAPFGTTLTFAAQGTAGKLDLTATAAGATPKTASNVTIASGTTTTTNFAFP